METLPTSEFLAKKLGLVNGNPFSETQAEEEERLPKYFLDLPAFYEILDTDTGKPKSSILSANRGCGKSANRRNVERWLKQGPKQGFAGEWPWESPVLVIPYTDFSRLKTLVDGDFSKTRPEDHVTTILWICVSSLLEYLEEKWEEQRLVVDPKVTDSIVFQLGHYLINYSTRWAHLRNLQLGKMGKPPSLSQSLDAYLEAACALSSKAEHLASAGSTALLQGFKEVVFAFGLKSIVILVDGIDELDLTANNPKMGAAILKPLISERALMQLDGVHFKFFLPDEVVTELKKIPETRLGERIKYYEMSWDENSIQLLLSERLKAFSNGSLQDLGQFAAPGVTDVGKTLALKAENNPRNLLKLCNWLLVHFEQIVSKPQTSLTRKNKISSPRSPKPRITKEIVDAAIKSFEDSIVYTSAYSTVKSKVRSEDSILLSENGWEITSDLRVVCKGKIVSSEKLDFKEYEVLSYLIQHAEKLAKREEIGQVVWKEKWVKKYDWVLNQTVLRLRKKIGPKRIETVRGMGYIFHAN